MARLSRDSSSWHAYGLAKKYEDWEYDPKHNPNRGKNKRKDTKRWCRGKEGKEHNFKSHKVWWSMVEHRCTECGKKIYKGV